MASIIPETSTANNIRKIIAASSAGSLIAWYDFYLFGSLATVIATQFFPGSNPAAALLATLATFATGFVMRPLGALIFGRSGDRIGRKYTFSLTLTIMGLSTFAIGLVPGYDHIGFAAPLIILLLRLLQGLAAGGEYGGAVTYVAEHSPTNRRGFFTSWIQATASLGLLISLGAILITRYALDSDHTSSIEKFNDWGWRIPFLLSILLVAISAYIRSKLPESPLFSRLQSERKLSVNPLKESFTRKANLKIVLLTLFGATMGQGVVFYTGQFYAQAFLEKTCGIDFDQSKTTLMIAIALGTPFFLIFGGWSDRIGRKWLILGGMLLAILTWLFLFRQLLTISGTDGRTELTDRKEIRSTVAFIGKSRDMARTTATYSYYADGMQVVATKQDTVFAGGRISANPETTVSRTLNPGDYWKTAAILFVMVLSVAMVSGPIAALLVELFPTRIRYTSLSLPYQVGSGIFGGLTPFIAVLLTTICTGNKLAGLWYPVGVTAACFVIGALFIPNSHRTFAHVN